MKRNISSIILVVSILSILAVASSNAHAKNRHEFRTSKAVASGPNFENAKGLPSCEAPMMLFTVPQDGIIYTTGEDVTLTANQLKAITYFVNETGSASVCQDSGVLVITGF